MGGGDGGGGDGAGDGGELGGGGEYPAAGTGGSTAWDVCVAPTARPGPRGFPPPAPA